MGPVQAIKTCFAKSFQFSGRATRSEFWWFTLFEVAVIMVSLWILDSWLYGVDLNDEYAIAPATEFVSLVFLAPTISVTMRRLQDCGWPSWPAPIAIAGVYVTSYIALIMREETWSWLSQVVTALLVLNVAILIAAVLPGKPGLNAHGPNPSEVPR